ncbi:parasite-infected erythrocyte surface protein [Plasmodium brasilianum]|uniref:Parasite-infected erythrocyte surface protein, putative n=2 Tax=Plasmodium (Plasmodium) TaxID=418103 RepID=A0A1A8VM60_PLAMA|nr:parasite-infected erythrocyte surface protein, putative [Plasmodium malariae]KAI4840951.1 parasite-infected erythrocyte surface protein [Plasmodium brasilianum]SBS81703.1 conserved Plasmodium protein, unknown function [Plasmodium malariae]SBT87151.1 parasite-infected erythrocyte surface protein, putative [Plasmodium malariae]
MKYFYVKYLCILTLIVQVFWKGCNNEPGSVSNVSRGSNVSSGSSGSSGKSGSSGGSYASAMHSFKAPLTVNDLNKGWMLDYSTASTNQYIVLVPNVYNRRGIFYNTKAIFSDSITVTFSFCMYKKYYKESIDKKYYKEQKDVKSIVYRTNIDEKNKENGFAFWLLHNPFTVQNGSVDNIILEEEEFGLYGYKKAFNGVGIFFKLNGNELILSGLGNYGKRNINLNDLVRRSYHINAVTYNDIINVKITTQKNEVGVFIYYPKNENYIHSFTLKKQIPKENYIAFSAYNFKEDEKIAITNANKYQPTYVGISEVQVSAKDNIILEEEYETKTKEYINEESSKVKNELSSNDVNNSVNELLNELTHNKDQTTQVEVLKSLIKIIQKCLLFHINNEKRLSYNFDILNENIIYIQDELKQIKKNISHKSEDPKYYQKIFSTELSSLKNLFHSHAQYQKKNIEDITDRLTKKIDNSQELKLLAEKAQTLEKIINKRNSSTSYLFALAFAALIVITLCMIYKKIRDVEKKHIL